MNDRFEQYPFKEFRAYVGKLRGDLGRVYYDDIDLMEIYRIAPWVYVLDIGSESSATTLTFRYIGTGMCSGLGADLTGKRINDVASERVLNAYCAVINTGRPHVLCMTRPKSSAENAMYQKIEINCLLRLAYPTYSAEDKIERILGVGQFISLNDPESDQFYEFTLD